jgi:tRNA(Ile2) C34 agmatinyltransferase TiaS
MRKKDGFSVAQERSADGILTPRTARFQEGLVVTRSAVSWAQTEERLRYENIDYKAEKIAENARQAAERERWARESALTGYLAEADTEDLAPDQRPRGRRPAGVPVVRKYGYNIFKDEDENGFLAYEPL